jgi:flagellar biosynthesis/type III secretory pathway protein FliH
MNSLIRSAKLDTAMRILDRVRPVPDARVPLTERDVSQWAPVNTALPMTEGLARDLADAESTVPRGSIVEEDPKLTAEEMSGAPIPSSPPPTMDELRILFSDELRGLREQAAEQGYTEGVTTGRAEAQQQYSDSVARLERVVAMLGDSLHKGIDGLTEIGAEVVFEAVAKIIGRSYIDRSGVTDVVKEVIRQAKDRSRLLIRVNPADYRELMGEREPLVEGLNAQHIELAADDRVELGGCLLETPSGNLDGRLEVQLQQLRDTLLSARHRRTESVLEP